MTALYQVHGDVAVITKSAAGSPYVFSDLDVGRTYAFSVIAVSILKFACLRQGRGLHCRGLSHADTPFGCATA